MDSTQEGVRGGCADARHWHLHRKDHTPCNTTEPCQSTKTTHTHRVRVREWELEALLNQLGNELELELLDRGYDKGNWFVTVRKVGEALL